MKLWGALQAGTILAPVVILGQEVLCSLDAACVSTWNLLWPRDFRLPLEHEDHEE